MFLVQVVQGVRESWDLTWTLVGVEMTETGAASFLRYGMSSVIMTSVQSVLVFAVANRCIILFVTEDITDDLNMTMAVWPQACWCLLNCLQICQIPSCR